MIRAKSVDKVIKKLIAYLHPGYFVKNTLTKQKLKRYLRKYLKLSGADANNYLVKVEQVKLYLKYDLEQYLLSDPAILSKDEVIITYPGYYAIMVYRLSHELYLMDYKLLARMMSEIAHSKTGIDIHPASSIAKGFFIDHGTGVVIGETTIIGNNVKIYQGVTLGAKSLNSVKNVKYTKRHPTISDNVTIYAGATILGGNTVIGKNVVIGGNVFLTSSIDDNKIVKLDNRNYKVENIK